MKLGAGGGEVRAREQSEKTAEEDGEAKRRVITREDKRGSDDMDITDQIDPGKWKKFMKKFKYSAWRKFSK